MVSSPQKPIAVGAEPVDKRVRLDFLNGIRGLAALWVVLYHIAKPTGLSRWAEFALGWLHHGRLAVAVFIVLSGYCLMLPAATGPDGRLPGGWRRFFIRRARRILPPYYAALLFTCLHIAFSQWHKSHVGGSADWSVFAAPNLVSHALLLHNLSLDWVQTIDPPMWSVATEWQIYFLFPLLLLVWRRWGSAAAVAAGFAAGLAPRMLLPAGHNFDWAYPWFLGLFAVGMVAAAINFSPAALARRRLTSGFWPALSVVCAALTGALAAGWLDAWRAVGANGWIVDTLAGLSAACLIIHCARYCGAAAERKPWALKLFESRAASELGRFSYSLYLMHFPLWWTIQPAFRALHLSPAADLGARVFLGIPIVLAGCYLFYVVFERPFTRARNRAASPAVAVS